MLTAAPGVRAISNTWTLNADNQVKLIINPPPASAEDLKNDLLLIGFDWSVIGDLIKKETGRSAQEYIQWKVIDVAKERIFDQSKSVSQVAYDLGFKYPQHFVRLFKQKVGHTPSEYRMAN